MTEQCHEFRHSGADSRVEDESAAFVDNQCVRQCLGEHERPSRRWSGNLQPERSEGGGDDVLGRGARCGRRRRVRGTARDARHAYDAALLRARVPAGESARVDQQTARRCIWRRSGRRRSLWSRRGARHSSAVESPSAHTRWTTRHGRASRSSTTHRVPTRRHGSGSPCRAVPLAGSDGKR